MLIVSESNCVSSKELREEQKQPIVFIAVFFIKFFVLTVRFDDAVEHVVVVLDLERIKNDGKFRYEKSE